MGGGEDGRFPFVKFNFYYTSNFKRIKKGESTTEVPFQDFSFVHTCRVITV